MFRRLTPLILVSLLLSIMLVACGDEAAPVPTYTGATSVAVPDSIKTQMGSSIQNLKNTQFEAFTTADDPAKVKSSFQDSFKSGGWEDKTSSFVSDSQRQQFESANIILLGYQKGNKGAVILGFPGSIAGPMGFSNVTSGTAYIVISGNS